MSSAQLVDQHIFVLNCKILDSCEPSLGWMHLLDLKSNKAIDALQSKFWIWEHTDKGYQKNPAPVQQPAEVCSGLLVGDLEDTRVNFQLRPIAPPSLRQLHAPPLLGEPSNAHSLSPCTLCGVLRKGVEKIPSRTGCTISPNVCEKYKSLLLGPLKTPRNEGKEGRRKNVDR
jgi:hypothetical protein